MTSPSTGKAWFNHAQSHYLPWSNYLGFHGCAYRTLHDSNSTCIPCYTVRQVHEICDGSLGKKHGELSKCFIFFHQVRVWYPVKSVSGFFSKIMSWAVQTAGLYHWTWTRPATQENQLCTATIWQKTGTSWLSKVRKSPQHRWNCIPSICRIENAWAELSLCQSTFKTDLNLALGHGIEHHPVANWKQIMWQQRDYWILLAAPQAFFKLI